MMTSIKNEKGEVIADVYGETKEEVDRRALRFLAVEDLIRVAHGTMVLIDTIKPIMACVDKGASTNYETGMEKIITSIRLTLEKAGEYAEEDDIT